MFHLMRFYNLPSFFTFLKKHVFLLTPYVQNKKYNVEEYRDTMRTNMKHTLFGNFLQGFFSYKII